MSDDMHLSEELLRALDTFAMDKQIGDRQTAVRTLLVDALTDRGYMPHVAQQGTRPEDLTTANDD